MNISDTFFQWHYVNIILFHSMRSIIDLGILKQEKQVNKITIYQSISRLPAMSKLFEKTPVKRQAPLLAVKIPDNKFGFIHGVATIKPVHRIVNTIILCFERKEYYSAAFLYFQQSLASWSLYKIKILSPFRICNLKNINREQTMSS